MADNVAGVGQQVARNNTLEEQTKNFPTPPGKLSLLPAWGAGVAIGESMAAGFLEQYPEIQAALDKNDMTEEDFTAFMQSMMTAVMSDLAKFAERFKDEDSEDKCAANSIYE